MSYDKVSARRLLDTVKAAGRTALNPTEGRLLCEAYGIPVPREKVAVGASEAAKVAGELGFPVVMKVVSPDILHKTEAGGVVVGIKSAAEAETAYNSILKGAKKYNANAKIDGVLIQQMLAGGHEVIVGALTDPSFGKVVAFGLGGVLVEVLKDVTFRLAPTSEAEALSMLDGIAAAEILRGVRGGEAADRATLAATITAVSNLVADFPEIRELDLNPVFARKDGAVAADVRVLLDFAPRGERYRPAQDEILRAMTRIMQPDAVAVIGASPEDGKIGNSVMKNLINGGYQGAIYPIHPKVPEVLGRKAYKSVKDVPGKIDVAVFAIPAPLVAGALQECGEKQIPGAVLIPSGFAETGNVAVPGRNRQSGAEVQRSPDGAEYLRLLLYAEESLRHLLHPL